MKDHFNPAPPELVFQPTATKVLPHRLTGTFYECLGVNPNATQAEIKAAYKGCQSNCILTKTSDKRKKVTELFQPVVEVFECLADGTKRQIDDRENGLHKFRCQKNTHLWEGVHHQQKPLGLIKWRGEVWRSGGRLH
jgi:hypothetical protein